MIEIESTQKTGYRYRTFKNKKNNPSRLEVKKYDPVLRKHVVFKEVK
jgi:large subunit ribosomal protein L33